MRKRRRTLVESVATSLSVPSQQITMFLGTVGTKAPFAGASGLSENFPPELPDGVDRKRLAAENNLFDLAAADAVFLQIECGVHPPRRFIRVTDDQPHVAGLIL